MEKLERIFLEAEKTNANFVGVMVTIPGQEAKEIIINEKASIKNKLEYYKKTYNENLIHSKCADIKIVGAGYGDTRDFEIKMFE